MLPHTFLYFFIFPPPSPLVSRQVGFFTNIALLPAHKMTKFCIYSRRPPPISSKKRFQPQRIEISVCGSSLFCIFNIGGVPPLVSRQVGFFANIALLLAHKMSKLCIYSKRPPPISSKNRFQPPRIEISGCCSSLFCIFYIAG